ncbi:MAG: hypothetical protein ACJ8CR_29275 [Roseiflexaceae bacterium]
MLALGPVREGDRVLDVGCGIGLEAARMARRVGSTSISRRARFSVLASYSARA